MTLAASSLRGGRRSLLIALIVIGVLAVAVALFVALFDWNSLRGPIARRVTAATGREFSIGHLDVDLGTRTRVLAKDIHFANAAWSKDPEMASVEAVEFRIYLPALLHGRVDLPYVHLTAPHVLIERDPQGRGNWQFGKTAKTSKPGRPPLIRDLTVDKGRLVVREARLKTNVDLTLHSLPGGEQRAPLVA